MSCRHTWFTRFIFAYRPMRTLRAGERRRGGRHVVVALALVSGATSIVRAQDRAAAVDSLFAEFTLGNTPGCVIGVVQRGSVALAKAYGMADLEHNRPLTPQSSFYMASVSKQFTALAVLLLDRDGKLRLDESVRRYIAELPTYADEITLRHLLHHTSGLRDYLTLGFLAGYAPDHVWTERAALRMMTRQRSLNYPVGSEHLYSNSGYALLAIVVERVSGRKLDEWAREQVFAPLAMSSTRFQHDHSRLIPDRAIGYVRQDSTWRLGISMLDVVGDGGLYSTLDDMLRWAANFDNGKVAPNQLALMHTPGTLKNGNAISNGYGMGLVRGSYRGLETISHGGALVGYRTAFVRLPGEKTTVVCLCNASTANPGRLAQRVADLYAGHAMSAAVATPNTPAPESAPIADAPVSAELRRAVVGTFHSAELDAVYVVREDGEQLIVEAGDRAPCGFSPAVRTGCVLIAAASRLSCSEMRTAASRASCWMRAVCEDFISLNVRRPHMRTRR